MTEDIAVLQSLCTVPARAFPHEAHATRVPCKIKDQVCLWPILKLETTRHSNFVLHSRAPKP